MNLSPSSEESYARLSLGRRWRRARGFRLCARSYRFSVRRLRTKLLAFLGLVGRHARRLGRRLSTRGSSSPCARSSSARALVGGNGSQRCCPGGETANKAPRRAASFMRTNSFYAQAIADCLEFIKRNSVPLEDYGSPVVVAGGARR
uniref:Uncharacterized protein n=1 Tax=Avena sativa TaxID=4498 RepID=A0ACD5YY29_AVESA